MTRALVVLVVTGLVIAALLDDGTWAQQSGMSATKSSSAPAGGYSQWKNGPSSDPAFFPVAVWLQDPKNAPKFKAAGINVYVGLWQGPTEGQLASLKKNGMKLICEQNDVALKHLDDPTIIGWMHGDEPDNAQDIKHWKSAEAIKLAWPLAPDQPLEKWGQYGPPIPPKDIVADYERIRKDDLTRPVMLNLGQGVAFDKYVGRGYRSGHMEDYPEYIKGCDIVSFDIYPVVHDTPQIAGKLWYVPLGIERLVKWTGGKKVVWDCIECTHIGNPNAKATPAQVRAEVWMSLIHGSTGLIYFVHEFKPKFKEAALLDDAELLKAVTDINKQIQSLAPVLNSPTLQDIATVESSATDPVATAADIPLAMMTKRQGGSTYLFVAAMRDGKAKAHFTVRGLGATAKAEVLGEDRTIDVKDGKFEDGFADYGVHIYKVD